MKIVGQHLLGFDYIIRRFEEVSSDDFFTQYDVYYHNKEVSVGTGEHDDIHMYSMRMILYDNDQEIDINVRHISKLEHFKKELLRDNEFIKFLLTGKSHRFDSGKYTRVLFIYDKKNFTLYSLDYTIQSIVTNILKGGKDE